MDKIINCCKLLPNSGQQFVNSNSTQMSKEKDLTLNLPQDLLVPTGDAILIKLRNHIKNGGQVKVIMEGEEEKTVRTEEELYQITEPFTNQ